MSALQEAWDEAYAKADRWQREAMREPNAQRVFEIGWRAAQQTLEAFRDELPSPHVDKIGLIRAIEVLRAGGVG